ncbi:MAG: hypothetical protein GKS06_03315 [Acidobacteria bacterium]|nr:hypothetical protein [Acidobacteriota bacterium]
MRRQPSIRYVFVIALVALTTAACGPTELATPSAAQAERLVGETFPEATIRVREVTRTEQTLRIPAEFNEADVIFMMEAGEEQWLITGVEQGGNTYTVDQLGEIAASMEVMRTLSDALERYKTDTGAYPVLDDLVGLRELVPDYYPAQGEMEDAWGSAFRYRVQGDDYYTVTSTGPDGTAGSRDDIILITGSFVEG